MRKEQDHVKYFKSWGHVFSAVCECKYRRNYGNGKIFHLKTDFFGRIPDWKYIIIENYLIPKSAVAPESRLS